MRGRVHSVLRAGPGVSTTATMTRTTLHQATTTTEIPDPRSESRTEPLNWPITEERRALSRRRSRPFGRGAGTKRQSSGRPARASIAVSSSPTPAWSPKVRDDARAHAVSPGKQQERTKG